MMVDLLAGHTAMPVLLATDGMPIERERVYVIPPSVYLSVDGQGRVADFKAAGATRLAASFRFPPEFAGSRIRIARRLRGPFRNRRRRPSRPEVRKGERRPRFAAVNQLITWFDAPRAVH